MGLYPAVEELMADMEENALTQVAIVHATGSGGTQAGLNAGVLLHGASADVISYAVCDDESYFNAKAQEDWENLRAYRSELPDEPIKTLTSDKYIGPGYGRAGDEIFDTLAELARLEGITLDPVYTGKAFHGLITDLVTKHLSIGGIRHHFYAHRRGIRYLPPCIGCSSGAGARMNSCSSNHRQGAG